MDHRFSFRLAPAEAALLPQLSRALEQRTEACARNKHPKMWDFSHKLLQRSKNVPPSLSKKRRLIRSVLAAVCFLLGLFLTIPFIFEPEGILIPGLVGIFAVVTGAVFLWCCSKKLLALLALPIGLLLTAGAVLDARQLGCFLPLGSIMLLLSAAALILRKRPVTDRFEKAARQLIDSRSALPHKSSPPLLFTENDIMAGDTAFASLSHLSGVYETEDLFLLELDGKFLMLQKKELSEGSPEEFRAFLSEKMK